MNNKYALFSKSFPEGNFTAFGIPHEIINFFKDDNYNHYIYLPAFGTYSNDLAGQIELVFIMDNSNGIDEILYIAEIYKSNKNDPFYDNKKGEYAVEGTRGYRVNKKVSTYDENQDEKLRRIKRINKKYCENNNISYGKIKLTDLHKDMVAEVGSGTNKEIKKKNKLSNKKCAYVTFKVKHIYKPNKRTYFVNSNDNRMNVLKEKQGYIRINNSGSDGRDYNKVLIDDIEAYDDKMNLIDDYIIRNETKLSNYWDNADKDFKRIDDIKVNNLKKTFLNLINQENREEAYTYMFEYFFKINKGYIFKEFLKKLKKSKKEILNIKQKQTKLNIPKNVNVKSETIIKEGNGRIDLQIETDDCIYIIENKINSRMNGVNEEENVTQITTYKKDAQKKKKEAVIFVFKPDRNQSLPTEDEQKYTNVLLYSEIYSLIKDISIEDNGYEFAKYFSDFKDAIYYQTQNVKFDIITQRFIDLIKSKRFK